jgi:hypothetical protein
MVVELGAHTHVDAETLLTTVARIQRFCHHFPRCTIYLHACMRI